MVGNLSRSHWLKAARLALLKGGVEAVRVEKLALALKVTKGSFYWHFKDRDELLEALLREWEEEKQLVFDLLGRPDLRHGLRGFFGELERRVIVSERGEWPSDAAIFAWAAVSPKIARRANKEEEARIRLLKKLARHGDIAEYVYMAYLGFLIRRRRVPKTAKNFRIFARITTAFLLNPPLVKKSEDKVRSEEQP
jgi:AcrR family transcriptional regulator